jgi:hypothetical protein
MQMELDGFLGISGTQIRSRDIGIAVAELFHQRRTQTQAVISDQLAKLAALPEGTAAELRLVDLPEGPTVSEIPPPLATKKRRRPMGLMAAIVLALLAGLGVVVWAASGETPVPPSAPAPRQVELRITAFPEKAVIALDGTELENNPHSEVLEPSTETHEIRVTAPGYEPAVRSVTFAEDTNLVISLSALPTQAPEPARTTPPVPVTSAPVVEKVLVEKKPGCDPPAYFDAKGLKHFKPECL